MQSDAIVNAILSFIIPGVGQAINGYKKKGIIMFVIALIMGILVYYFHIRIIGNIVTILYSLYAAYDAYSTY
ncbi:hypothetical protein [uncultured Methanobrevibacter sp.]|uniref:hypothetical protein n=1 Tax=uncultured Methanobrevibacter sp. TaxID=253161 RepID=UPI0025CDBBE9|nr:hypothetical protein [uncultured Methanobrevibacter sp.]